MHAKIRPDKVGLRGAAASRRKTLDSTFLCFPFSPGICAACGFFSSLSVLTDVEDSVAQFSLSSSTNMASNGTEPRERKMSSSAPITDLKGPVSYPILLTVSGVLISEFQVGPDSMSRPKHKRTATGLGPGEIKNVESSIPEGQRDA